MDEGKQRAEKVMAKMDNEEMQASSERGMRNLGYNSGGDFGFIGEEYKNGSKS